jgi:Helix-turn-helix domain
VRLIQLIRDTEDLSMAEKCLLYTLAAYGHNDGTKIYPGDEMLAKKLKVTERTIRRLKKRLISTGYLKETGRENLIRKYEIPMKEKWTDAQIAPNKGKPKKPLELVPPHAPDEESDEEMARKEEAFKAKVAAEVKEKRRNAAFPELERK